MARKLSKSAKATKPARPAKSVRSRKTAALGKGARAGKSAKTHKSTKPVRVAKPTRPAKPMKSAPPIKPLNPARTAEPQPRPKATPRSTRLVRVPRDYRPSEKEPFMNPRMRSYFQQKLLMWRTELMQDTGETLQKLKNDTVAEPDIADRAATETERAVELRTRDRARKLISKIDAALERIEDGTYGYCEETGEPIGIKRLEARPIATLSIEAQERHERHERTHRDE